MAKDPRTTSRPKTVNERLLDEAILHAHYLERFKTHEVREVVGFMNQDLIPSLNGLLASRLENIATRGFGESVESTKRLQAMVASMNELVESRTKKVNRKLETDMTHFAQIEAEWQTSVLKKVVPFTFDFTLPSLKTLQMLVSESPIDGRVMADWFNDLAKRTQTRVVRQLNIGIAAGEPNSTIMQRIRGTRDANYSDGVLQATRSEAESIVRTATNHVSTQTREATYEQNTDVVDSVRMVATLDARTTLVCQKQDGKVYPVGKGPRPPFHWGCRTTVIAVLKSWKELGIKGLKELDEGTRASMNGQVPGDITYPEWLKQQSRSFQEDVLGKSRAAMFRSGEVSIDQFTDNKGRTLTLEELRKLN